MTSATSHTGSRSATTRNLGKHPAVPAACLVGALSLTGGVPAARADGFRSGTIGTQGLAMSGGRIVFVDDASAVAHNPANLLELKRWEAALEPTLVYHSVEFSAPWGGTAETTDPWKFLPHAFAGGPLVEDRAALGLGITMPYGFSLDWQDGGALRYAAPHFVELQTLNVNPTLALRLGKGLNLGVGVDILWSQIHLEQAVPWGIPGVPDSDFEAEGEGVGVGGNLGLTWEFLPRHRLSATLRSPIDVDYDGTFEGSRVPLVPGGDVSASFDSEVNYPTIVGMGYGFAPTDRWRFAVQAEWIEFSRFQSLPVKVGGSLAAFSQTVPENWHDTWTAGVAASYRFAEDWTARASYEFFESPVPESTFSPMIPDANQHAITVGIGWRHGQHRLDVAYSKVLYETREISNNVQPAFIGEYEFDVHMISLAYGFRF